MNTVIIHNNRISAQQILNAYRTQIGNRHSSVHHLIDSRNHRHITAGILTNIEYILPVLTGCRRYSIHNFRDIILLNHLWNVISVADNRHAVYKASQLRRIVIYDAAGLCELMISSLISILPAFPAPIIMTFSSPFAEPLCSSIF